MATNVTSLRIKENLVVTNDSFAHTNVTYRVTRIIEGSTFVDFDEILYDSYVINFDDTFLIFDQRFIRKWFIY